MSPDLINGLFEFGGSVAVWLNFAAIIKDRGYAGTRWPMMVFFTAWGFWNLFFYPHLGQLLSFVGGISLTLANCFVVWAMAKYGRLKT